MTETTPEPSTPEPSTPEPPTPEPSTPEPIQPLNTAPAPLPATAVPAHGEADEPTASAAETTRADRSALDWRRGLVLAGIGILTVLVVFLLVHNLAPVWWARLIGDFAQEQFGRAVLAGLIVGFGFTLVPLMILLLLLYRWSVWAKIGLVIVAVVLAAPNLLTLWIHLGPTPATHAADRILDTDAFGFSASSRWGAIIGAVAFGFWAWLFVARHQGRKITTLTTHARDSA